MDSIFVVSTNDSLEVSNRSKMNYVDDCRSIRDY